MDKKGLSKEQQLDLWLDKREVRNLMGRITAYYAIKQDAKIFDDFWSQREDVCLGVNNGWFKGKSAVAGYYQAIGDRIAAESKMIKDAFPKDLGDKTDEELHGVGMMTYRPMCTQVIEMAQDGQTAKGIWCDRGSHSKLTAGGPVAYWEWGWFAVDFVKEGSDWKIWHMQFLVDICSPSGESWAKPEAAKPAVDMFKGVANLKDAEPNVPCTLREYYHPMRKFAPSPALPKPYKTFAETFSYGI